MSASISSFSTPLISVLSIRKPACKVITASGGIVYRRIRRIVGGGFGLRGGYAAVGVVGHGVGLGFPLRGKDIRSIGSRAEGVGVAGNGTVHGAFTRERPTGKRVTGSGGHGDSLRGVVVIRIGKIRSGTAPVAAVRLYGDGALVDRPVGGDRVVRAVRRPEGKLGKYGQLFCRTCQSVVF